MDHFNAGEGTTFKQRYLVNMTYWGGGGKPIFLYTGNEGDITWFCNNTVSLVRADIMVELGRGVWSGLISWWSHGELLSLLYPRLGDRELKADGVFQC